MQVDVCAFILTRACKWTSAQVRLLAHRGHPLVRGRTCHSHAVVRCRCSYGEFFVVENKMQPATAEGGGTDATNLAYTGLPLQFHTDLPHYKSPPQVPSTLATLPTPRVVCSLTPQTSRLKPHSSRLTASPHRVRRCSSSTASLSARATAAPTSSSTVLRSPSICGSTTGKSLSFSRPCRWNTKTTIER